LKQYEKAAFWKFFLMYFFSVALLVLAAGYFYFQQSRIHRLKNEEFSLLEFARHIKMGGPPGEFSSAYRYRFIPAGNRHIDINNFTIEGDRFVKRVPLLVGGRYIEVSKATSEYEKAMRELKERIALTQLFILLLFGLLSYRLAKNAIKPMEESIELLDTFAKDLIHDLNTPVTSIKLNLTLLEQRPQLQGDQRILQRLRKSAHTISELHRNLKVLLEEKTFQTKRTDLCEIVREVVEVQKPLYEHLSFSVECRDFYKTINPNAMKQLLQNIVSNACRYNRPGGYVKIYTRGRALVVEDSGIGIENPERIFDRDYSESGSSGLGLNIVKRLALAMQISIEVQQNEKGGTLFILTMP